MATKRSLVSRKERDERLALLSLALVVVFFVLTLAWAPVSGIMFALAGLCFGLFMCFLMESSNS